MTRWRETLGLPASKTRATWVDYVGLLLGVVPVLAVWRILHHYDVPEPAAMIIAFGWVFPSVYFGSRVTAWRERHRDAAE